VIGFGGSRSRGSGQATSGNDRLEALIRATRGVSAVVVVGRDMQLAARLAVALARGANQDRRVAIGDLAGDLEPIYALAGGDDADGLAECFRDGLGLSDVARPVGGASGLFVLPAGAKVDREPALLDEARWGRLIRGFADAGGLLILVARAEAPVVPVLGGHGARLIHTETGLPTPAGVRMLIEASSGDGAEAATLPARGTKPGAKGAILAAASVAILLGGAAGIWWTMLRNAPDGTVQLAGATEAGAEPEAPILRDSANAATNTRFELVERLPSRDSSRAVAYAIELMAANTQAMANSTLDDAAESHVLPAATVATVATRSGTAQIAEWHKAIVGAWLTPLAADSALDAFRASGAVERGDGAVVWVPYALLLADSTAPARAAAVIEVWKAKGVRAYALRQDDGMMRVYAGAFASLAQAIPMAVAVQRMGGTPIVAYRTGRAN